MARRIVITSGKGGVGKTTCSYLLGLNLAKLDARVVILDVDIGLNNLDVVAGIDTKINYDLIDAIQNRCRVRQALVQSSVCSRLYFLPCVNSYSVGRVTSEALSAVLRELDISFDYIIIDCPAGIGFEFHRAVFCANEAIIVTTPHMIALRDAGKVANLLSGYTLGQIGLVINRIRNDFVSRKMMISPEEIANSLKLTLLGTIRESNEITALSCSAGELFKLNDSAMGDFCALAKTIHYNMTSKPNRENFLDIKIKRG